MNRQWTRVLGMAAIFPLLAIPSVAQGNLDGKIARNIANWVGTYKFLHGHPELSAMTTAATDLLQK